MRAAGPVGCSVEGCRKLLRYVCFAVSAFSLAGPRLGPRSVGDMYAGGLGDESGRVRGGGEQRRAPHRHGLHDGCIFNEVKRESTGMGRVTRRRGTVRVGMRRMWACVVAG